jgi:hypothetical protein
MNSARRFIFRLVVAIALAYVLAKFPLQWVAIVYEGY